MRFDGYYMLSDLLEVPNLMQRSQQMLKFLALKHIYRVRNPVAPTGSLSEAVILLVYGIASSIYRIVLFFSITLYVMGKLFAIGLILAIWTAAMWFILPVGGFIHWLATNTQIAEHRPRAILVSLGLLAAILVPVGLVPFPDWRRADGVVESRLRSGVFIGAQGFVAVAHVRSGDLVRGGDPIVSCESPELQASIALALGQLAESKSRAASALTRDPAEAQIGADYVKAIEEQLVFLNQQRERLIVRAPHDGRVVSIDPAILVGAFVQEGQPVCEIVDESEMRITATLSQTEANWIFDLNQSDYTVEYRLASDVRKSFTAQADIPLPAGDRQLPHPGLGFGGGGTIELDGKDNSGMLAAQPFFKLRIYRLNELGERVPHSLSNSQVGVGAGRPGERVYVRFTLPAKPLAEQWIDRISKLIQGRARI